jgi:hypothetical protein
MTTITKSDIITVDSWRNLADDTWSGGNLPKVGIVYVIPEMLAEFIKLVISERYTENYLVISAESDYGLVSQNEHPVNLDMTPWLEYLISNRIGKPIIDDAYEGLTIPPRCNTNKCSLHESYSLKCAMYTHSTFQYIPDNIRIMTTNTDLVHPRVVKIPFGIRPSTRDEMFDLHNELFDSDKEDRLYINFTSYTVERRNLIISYTNRKCNTNEEFLTIEKDLPWNEYIRNMSKCKFVLSPQGNGIDCYRNLEAHYMGCATVMRSGTASDLIKIPHYSVPTLNNLGKAHLTGFEKIYISNWAKLSDWKEALHDFRRDS